MFYFDGSKLGEVEECVSINNFLIGFFYVGFDGGLGGWYFIIVYEYRRLGKGCVNSYFILKKSCFWFIWGCVKVN